MPIIKAKNREGHIKILKKLGETVIIAKGEVMYAFKKEFFPYQTTEEIMEGIKKDPKSFSYYKVGSIKITEIKEV
ncbi:hypothetical protein LCGC14_2430880 [marine sediment metagenome]|uniref:Uncharacterized protein n=1 Tax=marine sediment metagenome TaxID=412755 RepID=A0A0F9EFX1_9ZZZZ